MTPDIRATVARLRELHEKATPPPWNVEPCDGGEPAHPIRGEAVHKGSIVQADWLADFDRQTDEDEADRETNIANATLCAESRNALPALLDALESDHKHCYPDRCLQDDLAAAREASRRLEIERDNLQAEAETALYHAHRATKAEGALAAAREDARKVEVRLLALVGEHLGEDDPKTLDALLETVEAELVEMRGCEERAIGYLAQVYAPERITFCNAAGAAEHAAKRHAEKVDALREDVRALSEALMDVLPARYEGGDRFDIAREALARPGVLAARGKP